MRRVLVVAACAGLIIAFGSFARGAEPVRILFVARVQNVYDPGGILEDAIQVGALLRGTVSYEAPTADAHPRVGIARYEYHRPPNGFSIEAGPFLFQTDPRRVDFAIEVVNDAGAPPRDRLVLTSRNNQLLQNGATVSRISWELGDDTLKALHTTSLPSTAPDLNIWQSEFGLTLEGLSPAEFIIRAHAIEAALCTPTMRCPSPQ